MNRLLFYREECEGDYLPLRDRRARHLLDVLKVKIGDLVKVGEINGQVGVGHVVEANRRSVQLRIELRENPPAALAVQVVLCLPRPKALGRILEYLTELGIKRIVLLNSARVEKYYWDAHQLKPPEIKKHLLLGLEQCGDTMVPEILLKRRFRPFVEDELAIFAGETAGWVAHPYAEHRLPRRLNKPVTLIIGPEGGWVDFELELLAQHGMQLGHFGQRILKTETALAAILGGWID